MQRTLDQSALAAGVEVLERTFALDVVVGTASGGGRQAAGIALALLDAAAAVSSVGVASTRAVVLATGGYGQVFAATSNPPAVTGDGVAIAMRAGLDVSDVEFVQSHPTVLSERSGRRRANRLSSAKPSAARGRSSTTAPATG